MVQTFLRYQYQHYHYYYCYHITNILSVCSQQTFQFFLFFSAFHRGAFYALQITVYSVSNILMCLQAILPKRSEEEFKD